MNFKPLLRLLRETPRLKSLAIVGGVIALAEVAIVPSLAHTIRLLVDGFLGKQATVYWRLAPIAFGLFAIHAFVAWCRTRVPGRIAELGCAALRQRAAGSLLNMPVPRLDSIHTGDHLSRLTNDVSVLRNYLSHQLFWMVTLPLMGLASIGYQTYISWQLTLTTIALMPAMIWLTSRASQPIGRVSRQLQQDLAAANNVTQDALGGTEVVRAFNLQSEMERKYETSLNSAVKCGLSLARQRAILRAASVVGGFMPFFLPLALGGWFAISGLITVGCLIAFIQLLHNVTFPLSQMPMVVGDHQRAMAALDRIFELVDEERERTGGERYTDECETVLELRNVSFSYGDELVLDEFDLCISRGETAAIVGPSGAGKSTVFKLLTGFYPPCQGEIRLFGQALERWQLAAARRQMALVAQDTFLFPGTIAENIALGRPEASKEDIIRAARQANAHEFIEELPAGYNHILTERGANLSGGQRQRIAIARAVLLDAPLFLLDEATSALDSESERLIQDALDSVAASRTTLIIAHRLSTIRSADRVLVVDGGRIAQQGSHQELMEQAGLYRQLYLRQSDEPSQQGGAY